MGPKTCLMGEGDYMGDYPKGVWSPAGGGTTVLLSNTRANKLPCLQSCFYAS